MFIALLVAGQIRSYSTMKYTYVSTFPIIFPPVVAGCRAAEAIDQLEIVVRTRYSTGNGGLHVGQVDRSDSRESFGAIAGTAGEANLS
jgi:hypothetical protein